MRALIFEQVNVNLAEEQPQYETLPAYYGLLGDKEHETGFVVCFELTDDELQQVVANKKIWYSQLTFGAPFQPMNLYVENDIFDQRPLEEQPKPERTLFDEKMLVAFGNYLLSTERKNKITNPGSGNAVTDADLQNFKQSLIDKTVTEPTGAIEDAQDDTEFMENESKL